MNVRLLLRDPSLVKRQIKLEILLCVKFCLGSSEARNHPLSSLKEDANQNIFR